MIPETPSALAVRDRQAPVVDLQHGPQYAETLRVVELVGLSSDTQHGETVDACLDRGSGQAPEAGVVECAVRQERRCEDGVDAAQRFHDLFSRTDAIQPRKGSPPTRPPTIDSLRFDNQRTPNPSSTTMAAPISRFED
jgi:hypothetical protein